MNLIFLQNLTWKTQFFFCDLPKWCCIWKNELPEKIKTKLRKIIYPEQTKEEIESISTDINSSLYDEGQKNILEEIDLDIMGILWLW